MPTETGTAYKAMNGNGNIEKRSPIGNWEVHSCGDGEFPGMAVISAITTLQIGATLASIPADKIAMNQAAEYLMKALAPQLKSFRHALVG
jgi:hypothetical protein